MLPQGYEFPAAVLLVLSGAVACFAGYRLFRLVLAIYGFILGAMLASSMMGITNSLGMVLAAVVGGLAGALILVFAYFVAIALVGAGLGALIANVGWTYIRTTSIDPPPVAVIALAIAGAVGAMILQRYVIIVATAFGGAWTLIVGGLALSGDSVGGGRTAATNAASAGSGVWILYPTSAALSRQWLVVAWIGLGLIGTLVQLGITGRKRR
jgi:hypothetical protein